MSLKMITRRPFLSACIAVLIVVAVVAFSLGRSHGHGSANAQANAAPSYTPSYTPAPEEASGDVVLKAEMIGEGSAWALTERRLALTVDGGESWQSVTPHGLEPGAIKAVRFVSPQRGWVVASPDPGALAATLEVFSTADGGKQWGRTAIEDPTQATVGAVELAFDGNVGWALVGQQGDTGSNAGAHLYVTDDGGVNWASRPAPPVAVGGIEVDSEEEGWLEGGVGRQGIWRTTDAGRTWTPVELKPPAGLDEDRPGYSLPQIETDGFGILSASFTGGGYATTVATYVTADGGVTWSESPSTLIHLKGGIAPDGGSGAFLPLGEGELGVFDPGNADLTVIAPKAQGSGHAGSPSSEATQGLSTDVVGSSGLPGPGVASFAGREDGLVLVNEEHCTNGTHCSVENGLYLSVDGGRTWHPSSARP